MRKILTYNSACEEGKDIQSYTFAFAIFPEHEYYGYQL